MPQTEEMSSAVFVIIAFTDIETQHKTRRRVEVAQNDAHTMLDSVNVSPCVGALKSSCRPGGDERVFVSRHAFTQHAIRLRKRFTAPIANQRGANTKLTGTSEVQCDNVTGCLIVPQNRKTMQHQC